MKKSIAALFCLLSSQASAEINQEYEQYLSGEKEINHDIFQSMWKTFKSENGMISPNHGVKSEEERMKTFAEKVERIRQHNLNSKFSYKKGINQFSDMTHEEFKNHFNIKSIGDEQHCSATNQRQSVKRSFEEAPSSWDWREHNGVSPIKDQGACGSCWTFSTVGCLEAHSLIKYGSFDSLSEQQLVDCADAFDNHGCNGGLPSHAFEYITAAGGISTESAYPYYAFTNDCTVDKSTFALTVKGGSVNITQGDEDELKEAIYAHGPVSVAFQVDDYFEEYTGGVFSSETCQNQPEDVNHAVLAVGYGNADGKDYWIIKNSWGTLWGEDGFFRIERGVNMCGIAVCNSFPSSVEKISTSLFLQ